MALTQTILRTLFVNTPGTRLVLDGDAVKAITDEHPPRRLPLIAIESIVAFHGVDVSTPLLIRCAEDGRSVAFLSRYGRPRAFVTGPTSGRGRLRRLQYSRQLDSQERDKVAVTVVSGKIKQMQWGLRQWARDAGPDRATHLRGIASDLADVESRLTGQSRQAALGLEGLATKKYYRGMAAALRGAEFKGRSKRPPKDPVNAALSFLYGMMRIAVTGAIETVGLDTFCGYLHGDRDGQPSLSLDLLEEFRPEMDRLAVTLFNRGQLTAKTFDESVVQGFSLSDQGREIVMTALHEHRNQRVYVRGFVEAVPRAALPLIQAHALANALRSGGPYVPHLQKVS